MEPNKVVQALKVLQDEGREDLLKEGVLEQAWVGLRRPKRVSAEGVSAAVAACTSPIKRGKKFKAKSLHGRKVTRSLAKDQSFSQEVSVMQLAGAGRRRGGGRFSRRQGASLARRLAAGGRDSFIPSAVSVAERQGAQAVSAHARVISGSKHARSPLETGVGRVAGHLKERTLGGAVKMAASSGSDWAIRGALEERSLGVADKMAAPIIVDNTEVVVISDDEESVQQGHGTEDQNLVGVGLVSRRGVEWEAQSVHRFVSPMINKVQSWQKDNEAVVRAGEQVDVVAGCGSCGSLFSGRFGDEVLGDQLVSKAYGSMDFLQSGAGEGTSGCGTPYALGGHRAKAIYQPSGRMVGDRSVLVKARALSEHQLEERVRSGAVRPTAGDSMRTAEVQPSTSQGAGVGWADWEELLDYDEELEEPVASTKRVMVAEEESGVVQGGRVPVRASGNLPRGEESLVEFLRLHRGLDKVRMVRGARVGRGRLEGGIGMKVDASIQVSPVKEEGKSQVSVGDGDGASTKLDAGGGVNSGAGNIAGGCVGGPKFALCGLLDTLLFAGRRSKQHRVISGGSWGLMVQG
ncbi:hypothetical protein NDU88_005957 [Pleurodeles waltl]|uniref:Uncharacterized protein n=1 Tax=Pleurodeles waltl TaxID=8319 RepID=A0AAV7MBJ2_PLEWA|nr:hypothetical protein NDU88_005957 [Pleurodeles waltl]